MANVVGVTKFQVGDTVAVVTSSRLQSHWHEIREIRICIDDTRTTKISYYIRDIRMPGTTYEMPEDALYSPEEIKVLAQAVEEMYSNLDPYVKHFLRWALKEIENICKAIKDLTS